MLTEQDQARIAAIEKDLLKLKLMPHNNWLPNTCLKNCGSTNCKDKCIYYVFWEDNATIAPVEETSGHCGKNSSIHHGELPDLKPAQNTIAQTEPIKEERWKPKLSDEYYYIDDTFDVKLTIRSHHEIDNPRFMAGNCFKTEAKANEIADKIKQILKK